MRRIRPETQKGEPVPGPDAMRQLPIPLDDGTVTLAMIQALIPLGLKAVEEALQAEVTALAGARYGRGDADPAVVR